MELQLNGKVVVITGGAGGIGTAIARAFAQEGATVAICDISEEKLAQTASDFAQQGIALYTKPVDVTVPSQLEAIAQDVETDLGSLDVWINNAGILAPTAFFDITESLWDKIFAVNVKHTFFGTMAAAQRMKKRGGVILNTCSSAYFMPASMGIHYSATKSAIASITRTTAGVLAPYGIRVNAVAPGTVMTPMMANDPPRALGNALQRPANPEEIADAFVYLASDHASYITATVLDVTGGKYCIQDLERPWLQAKQEIGSQTG